MSASYVIIGNGVAGATAADQIRKNDDQGSITVFSQEPEPFYYRPRLPELVAGETELAKFTLHDESWYTQRGMDLRLGEAVTEVDLDAGRVRTSAGGEAAFDSLLLATGSRPFIPPVPGADMEGVFALRSAADARALRAHAKQCGAAVLVGGGLLGLEAGSALAKLGLKVRVVEFFDRLLPRQLDAAGAAKLQELLEGRGFEFHLGAKAQRITGQGRVEGLDLEGGQSLEAGLVLFSAGIRPCLDLAQQMGLDTDKGVKVDDRLMTSREGVWAAGDLVEHRGRIYGIWPASREQGEVAGANMAGGAALYQGTVMSNSLKVVGVDLTSAGDIDAEGKHDAAVYEAEGVYRKIVADGDGKMIGIIFFGTTDGVRQAQQALERGVNVGHLLDEMRQPDFDFGRLAG